MMNKEMRNKLEKIAIIIKQIPNMSKEQGMLILSRLKTQQQADRFLEYLEKKTLAELKEENLIERMKTLKD